MNFLQSFALGIVQGVTEWLPISSTAHLKIVPALLGWQDPGAASTAVMQIGTVASVVVYFAKDLMVMTRAFFRSLTNKEARQTPEARMAWAVIVGTIPVCVAALLLKHYIEGPLRDLRVIAGTQIVMALALLAADLFLPKKRGLEEVQVKDGLTVGLAQCLALIPGASRSGSTLTGAFLTGLNREAAARFSFLLSVPATLLAGLFELKDVIKPEPGAAPMTMSTAELAVATVVAGVVGYATIAWLIGFLKKHPPIVFVVYRIALGIALFLLVQFHVLKP